MNHVLNWICREKNILNIPLNWILPWNEWMNHILNQYLPFLIKKTFSIYFGHFLGNFWAISLFEQYKWFPDYWIELSFVLNHLNIFELNNFLNWILGKAILNRILNESFFGKIQILNWIRLGIVHHYFGTSFSFWIDYFELCMRLMFCIILSSKIVVDWPQYYWNISNLINRICIW